MKAMNTRRLPAWLILSALLIATPSFAEDVAWRKDYATARKDAQELNRPLMLVIGTTDCPWCTRLESVTFRDSVVVKLLSERFVSLKVHGENYPALIAALHIESYPTVLVASPLGKIIEVQKGYAAPAAFAELLGRALAKLPPPDAASRSQPTGTLTARPSEPVVATPAVRTPYSPPTSSVHSGTDSSGARNDAVPTPPGIPAPQSPETPLGTGEPAWMHEDFRKASDAVSRSEFSKALPILKSLTEDRGTFPVQTKAAALLKDIEKQASAQLVQLKEAIAKEEVPQAIRLAEGLARSYEGTAAATEAAPLLRSLRTQLNEKERERMQGASALLQSARDDFKIGQWLMCLLRCEELIARYSDLPECTEASDLANRIKNNADRMQKVCDGLPDVLSLVYLATAETKLKQGEPQQAIFFLERILQAFPNSKHAEMAQVRLSQIQGPPGPGASEERKP
jgi:hypothetical protein